MTPKDEEGQSIQTTIRVRPRVWLQLRALAEARSLQIGGRPNASAVIEELIEREAAKKAKR